MEVFDFIKIDKTKCISCLQCLRSCKVNAIRYVDSQLFIHPQRCVMCGDCYENCSYGAVEIKDVTDATMILPNKSEITIEIGRAHV